MFVVMTVVMAASMHLVVALQVFPDVFPRVFHVMPAMSAMVAVTMPAVVPVIM
jgi:hypothetical protein